MSTQKLKNISLSKYESFLELALCKHIGTKGGHLKYSRADLLRPIIVQSHIDPVPEFIIKSALRSLDYSKEDFFDILSGKKEVIRSGNTYTIRSLLDKI